MYLGLGVLPTRRAATVAYHQFACLPGRLRYRSRLAADYLCNAVSGHPLLRLLKCIPTKAKVTNHHVEITPSALQSPIDKFRASHTRLVLAAFCTLPVRIAQDPTRESSDHRLEAVATSLSTNLPQAPRMRPLVDKRSSATSIHIQHSPPELPWSGRQALQLASRVHGHGRTTSATFRRLGRTSHKRSTQTSTS